MPSRQSAGDGGDESDDTGESEDADVAAPDAAETDDAGGDPDRSDGGTDEDGMDVDAEDEADDEENGDETVPAVDLDLYQLSVSVSGQSTDSVEDVEATARRLMDYLVEQAKSLEEGPDTRGLG